MYIRLNNTTAVFYLLNHRVHRDNRYSLKNSVNLPFFTLSGINFAMGLL